MQKRVSWLLAQRSALDIRWVLHSGDVHNWPTPLETPPNQQFISMSSWFQPLKTAGLAYVLTSGNHDSGAVCAGGSACPNRHASVGLRDMSAWDTYYQPSTFGLEGEFESGKSANGWRTFSAGGKNWLVLSLELWPRTVVIDWAKQVVQTHPRHNVIVVTHSFLEGDGSLSTSNGGYGSNSPSTLWNALDDFPNVMMFFSGHVGNAATTLLRASDGHRVVAYLQAFHDTTYNPTRIVTVDPAAGTIFTRILASYNKNTRQDVAYEYTQFRGITTGMQFVS